MGQSPPRPDTTHPPSTPYLRRHWSDIASEVALVLPGDVSDVWSGVLHEPSQMTVTAAVPDILRRTVVPYRSSLYKACAEALKLAGEWQAPLHPPPAPSAC